MKRPPRAKPVNRWRNWPQKLAINEVKQLYPWGAYTVRHPGHTMLDTVHECGLALAKRAKVSLDKVVVFYPINRRGSIQRRLNRVVRECGSLNQYKGLTISSTRKLEAVCVAFLIRDVEAHRTPADAYYTMFHPHCRRASPIPLYGEKEGKIGKEVHE